MIIALHERLGIDIRESNYGELTTLNSLVGYLAKRLASVHHET